MKVRIYFPFAPFPITEGAYLIVADQLRHFLARGHEVELVCWRETAESLALKKAKSGALAAAKWRLLGSGRESRWARIGRVAASLGSKFASPELFHYPRALLPQLGGLGPADLAIYHYSFAYSWLCTPALLADESRRVVHLHNIESDLHGERGGAFNLIHRWNSRKLCRHEAALDALVDELWFLSPVDSAKLRLARSRGVPPTFDPGLRERRRPSKATEVVVGFIGGMDFRPNLESARWLLEELAPRLAAGQFRGKLMLAGRGASKELRRLGARYPFVEFPGFVEDLDAFWAQLSFLAVPHIMGSGVRTKILEGMASGVPVLTNPAGASALPSDARTSPFLFLRSEAEDWAEVLLAEAQPYSTRRALQREPTCRALMAEVVYAGVA